MINWNKELFNIKINWAAISAFVVFWTYGFFGALTGYDIGFAWNALLTILLYGIFLFFIFLWQKSDYFKYSFRVTRKDAVVWISFFLMLFILSFSNLTASLNNDQLAHAQQSQNHGITVIYFLSGVTNFFNDFSFNNLLWAINLIIFFIGLLIYFLLKNRSFSVKIIVLSLLFLSTRIIILYLGGSGGPHPPFRLFPLWLSAAFLGGSDLSFRLPQLIGLVTLMWFAWKMTVDKIGPINSWLAAFSIGTIPVLWHVGILAEQSVWTAILWTAFLVWLYNNKNNEVFSYAGWVSLIAIFTLMRQPAFIALVPVFILILYDYYKGKISYKNILLSIAPLLIMIPFLASSIIQGTPASYAGGNIYGFSPEASSMERVFAAISSGAAATALLNSIGIFWIILALGILIMGLINYLKVFAIIFFFISGFYVFYSITPDLWGMGRYQAEYFIPFSILGFIVLIDFLYRKPALMEKLLPVLLIILLFWNINVFLNISKLNYPADGLVDDFNNKIKKRGESAILSEFPYDYKKAFTEVRKSGYAGNIYVLGATYGILGEIINGFTVSEVMAEKNIYDSNQTIEDLNNDERIKLIMITDFKEKSSVVEKLKDLGWTSWKDFENKKYGLTIIGLVRGE
jgi:hypothetical protein